MDAADVYSRGVSEEIIGRWLAARAGVRWAGRRDQGSVPDGRRTMTPDSAAHHALEASLRRLQVDHIDLYQAHAWDMTPIRETLAFLDGAVHRPRSVTSG